MTEQWQELKETITEMRDNDGTGTQQDVCKFLANYMEVLEKQIQEPCEDCISRAEVRRILGNEVFELMKLHTVNPEDNPKADAMSYGVNWSLNTLMELPSVTPQRPRGKWIHPYKSDIACECSECHIQMPITNYYHYCPNCGAGMGVKE